MTEIQKARKISEARRVTAQCIDCNIEFTGSLGVSYVKGEHGENDYLEFQVILDDRQELHAFARVDRHLIPGSGLTTRHPEMDMDS